MYDRLLACLCWLLGKKDEVSQMLFRILSDPKEPTEYLVESILQVEEMMLCK